MLLKLWLFFRDGIITQALWIFIFISDLIHCTNEPNVSIPQLANLLIERSQNTNWVVVYKALITVHHMMCYGNEVSILNCKSKTGPKLYSGSYGYKTGRMCIINQIEIVNQNRLACCSKANRSLVFLHRITIRGLWSLLKAVWNL